MISIVTVVYNSSNLLEKTIQSVINQTYPLVEYIVVDGGSTDGSIDIINKYKEHLLWTSEKDDGIYDAMNKGVMMASGKWICFLNSGDIFVDDNILQKVVDSALSNENNDVVYGNIMKQASGNQLKEKIAQEPCNKHRMYFCHQSAFVKTEILRKNSFDKSHRMSADLKFFKECYKQKYNFLHLNFPIVIYDTSGISNTNRIEGIKDNILVIKEVDKGIQKYKFLLSLYFVIFWRKITGKQ